MMRWVLGTIAVVTGCVAAYAQFQVGGQGHGAPGAPVNGLQFNLQNAFGGITGVTSDGANVGFATPNQPILYGQTPGLCLTVDANFKIVSQSCAAGSQTGIAAGNDITTSGTASNVTVNVVATPSFTTVIASGNITAGSAQFAGFLTAGGANISGLNLATGTISGNLTGATANFSGNLTAQIAQFPGFLTASGASLQTATIAGLGASTQCLESVAGVITGFGSACGGTSATNIAAGTNITTSGTTSNVTVNVVATPTFTSVTSTLVGITGWLTASGVNLQTATIASFSAPTQCVQATNGILAGTGVACATQTSTPSIAAGTNITTSGTAANTTVNVVATPSFTSVIASGDLTAARAQFTGFLTASGANLQTATIVSLGATTQCLESVAGVVTGFGSPCATQTSTPSIAAGTNITTSGTAANVTVNMVPTTPEFGLQYNHAGVLTADSGFTYFGGIATLTLGSVTTTNARALSIIETLSSTTVLFDAPWFMNITTSGFAVGSKLADIQASGLSVFSVSPSGSLSSAALSSAASQCLQASLSGTILGFGVPCATQVSTPSIAAGTNITTSGTAANTTVNLVATPSVTTLIASGNLTAATAQFSGFLTAGGASLSGLTIVTATHTGNLTGTTANFSGNLTGTTAQFTGAVTGTTATFQTYTGSTANLSGNLTGTTAQFSGAVTGTTATFQTVTAQNFTTLAQGFVAVPAAGSGTAFLRGDNTFSTPTTLGLSASTTTTPLGWVNVNGQGRLTADSVGFITTGVVNLITLNGLVAGRTYYFNAELPLKSATASTGGIALRVGGGATATSIVYDGWIVDSGFNGIKGNTQATALSTSVANSSITGTTSHARLVGTITVNAAGSIVLQAAGFSTVTAASAVTVGRGATFTAQDIP